MTALAVRPQKGLAMGLIDDLMKGAHDLAGFDTPKKEEKPNVIDKALDRLDATVDGAFEQVFEKAVEAAEVEKKLYELAYTIVREHRGALGKAGLDLIDDYETRGDVLDTYPTDHWRWGHLERRRAEARDDLLRAAEKNEAIPAELRAQITEAFGARGPMNDLIDASARHDFPTFF